MSIDLRKSNGIDLSRATGNSKLLDQFNVNNISRISGHNSGKNPFDLSNFVDDDNIMMEILENNENMF